MILSLLISCSLTLSSLQIPNLPFRHNKSPNTTSSQMEVAENYDGEMLSLAEYNEFWGNGETNLIHLPDSGASLSLMALSPIKYQTGYFIDSEGDSIGYIILQYQTDILGGRPQFIYDTCYLSHPTAYNGWAVTSSSVSFSGDCIRVYADFIFGAFEEYGAATFYPL